MFYHNEGGMSDIFTEFQELESLFLYKINCGYNSLKNMKVLKSLTMNACNIDEFSFLEEKVPDMRRCDGIKELIFDCIKNLSDISELIYSEY